MKILVMSDTHGLLRPQVREMLGECDAVIHCGDYHTQNIVEEIKTSVRADIPIFLIRGNNDGGWAGDLPDSLEFVLGGVKFYAVHDKKDLPGNLGDNQVILFGHSHRYLEEWRDGRLYLNPGSCGRRRFRLDITAAFLYLEEGKISVEKMEIPDRTAADAAGARSEGSHECSPNGGTMKLPVDLSGTIRNIMKRMDKGQQVDKISRDLKLESDFVEDVCRIRVTHPGVSAEGILNKMEVNRSSYCNNATGGTR